MKTILNLGCGSGNWPDRLARPKDACLIGVDISYQECFRASQKEQELSWICVCAKGEQLPLRDASMDFVVATVALPYMDIPAALQETQRVLKPGGVLDVTLHTLRFTARNIGRKPPRTPRALLYRFYVIANGIWFHLSGQVVRFVFSNRYESWQSERGIAIALRKAGFEGVRYVYLAEDRFVVQAHRSSTRL